MCQAEKCGLAELARGLVEGDTLYMAKYLALTTPMKQLVSLLATATAQRNCLTCATFKKLILHQSLPPPTLTYPGAI